MFLLFFLVPSSAPDSLQVMVHNSMLAEVHWEPVPVSSVRGKLQGYKVLKKERVFIQHVFIVHTAD